MGGSPGSSGSRQASLAGQHRQREWSPSKHNHRRPKLAPSLSLLKGVLANTCPPGPSTSDHPARDMTSLAAKRSHSVSGGSSSSSANGAGADPEAGLHQIRDRGGTSSTISAGLLAHGNQHRSTAKDSAKIQNGILAHSADVQLSHKLEKKEVSLDLSRPGDESSAGSPNKDLVESEEFGDERSNLLPANDFKRHAGDVSTIVTTEVIHHSEGGSRSRGLHGHRATDHEGSRRPCYSVISKTNFPDFASCMNAGISLDYESARDDLMVKCQEMTLAFAPPSLTRSEPPAEVDSSHRRRIQWPLTPQLCRPAKLDRSHPNLTATPNSPILTRVVRELASRDNNNGAGGNGIAEPLSTSQLIQRCYLSSAQSSLVGPSSVSCGGVDPDSSLVGSVEVEAEIDTTSPPGVRSPLSNSILSPPPGPACRPFSASGLAHHKFMFRWNPFRKKSGILGVIYAQSKKNRVVSKHGKLNTYRRREETDEQHRYLKDFFISMIDFPWSYLLFGFAASFFLSWLFFAVIWYLIVLQHGDLVAESERSEDHVVCVDNIKDFTSCFLFSLETQHTIGYGVRATTEHCPLAVIVMSLQSIFGVIIQACMAGIVFAKFTKPTMRAETILFSKNALITMRNGSFYLICRVADLRPNHLLESHVSGHMVKKEVTEEGEEIPYHLMRMEFGAEIDGTEDFFQMFWPSILSHRITEDSPLWEISPRDLTNCTFEIVLTMEGTTPETGNTIQVRTSYLPNEILWGYRFEHTCVSYDKVSAKYAVSFSNINKHYADRTPRCSAKEWEERKIRQSSISASSESGQ